MLLRYEHICSAATNFEVCVWTQGQARYKYAPVKQAGCSAIMTMQEDPPCCVMFAKSCVPALGDCFDANLGNSSSDHIVGTL